MTDNKHEKLLTRAIKRLRVAKDADSHNRLEAIEDLNFLNGDQWDPIELQRRERSDRPAMIVNLLPKFVNQVVGDMLHITPSIKVLPANAKSDPNVASIRQGIIKAIEYDSNSKAIYGYAAKQVVACGYGAWRVLTRYCDDNPFLQEIYMESIRNPFLVYMDPTAKDQNFADAKWGFVIQRIPLDEFEELYPNAKYPVSIDYGGQETWFDGETVTVAEYFEKTTVTEEMALLADGRVMTVPEFDKIRTEWRINAGELIDNSVAGTPLNRPITPEPRIVSLRETERTVIKQWIITGNDVISGDTDGNLIPGKYIPVVLIKGQELDIEGKNYISSLIRNAKDSQRMLNYWHSAAAETIALAPKTPWLATPKQIDGFENDFAAANVENFPVLFYNPDSEAGGPPQRQAPPPPPVAMFEQIRNGEENLKSTIGMFNSDVGAGGSEQTGEAVRARQAPGDIGTSEFFENLSRGILYTGKIINSMIPEVYDTVRDVKVRNFDDSETFLPINTTVGNAIQQVESSPDMYGLDLSQLHQQAQMYGEYAEFNDISNGKYDLTISTGPSYATQRQESQSYLMRLVQAMPQQMAVASDLLVESMEFEYAEELARRLRLPLVQQGLVPPRKGEPQPEPQGPSPETQVQMALIEVEKAKTAVNEIRAQNEAIKAEVEKMRLQRDMAEFQMRMELAKADNERKEVQAHRDYQITDAKLKAQMLKVMKELQQ